MDTGVLRANDNERWEPNGDGALQTTPSELVKWADNYRRPRVGGQQLLAAQLGRGLPGRPALRGGIVRRRERSIRPRGDWLGFESSFQVSADHTRSMAVSCNSWAIDINNVSGQLNAIWTAPQA